MWVKGVPASPFVMTQNMRYEKMNTRNGTSSNLTFRSACSSFSSLNSFTTKLASNDSSRFTFTLLSQGVFCWILTSLWCGVKYAISSTINLHKRHLKTASLWSGHKRHRLIQYNYVNIHGIPLIFHCSSSIYFWSSLSLSNIYLRSD